MAGMTEDQTAAFLDEPGHLLRIGTTDADGMPLVVPIWFIAKDNQLLFTPRAKSAWFGHLKRDPRACCTVDETNSPMRKVVAQGAVEVVHDVGNDNAWRDIYRDITLRYVPPEFGDAYLSDTHDEPRALLALPLASAQVTTWVMPHEPGDDLLAVWSRKYYHDGR